MERLEKFYNDFKRPPFAPVYTPTAEEFVDPIAYVAKIKPEAEKYGVVKIIPPENFKPPFVIDGSKFEFTPRVQKLNEIEAVVRERFVFIEKLLNYWKLQGVEVRFPVIENRYLDLFRLHTLVSTMGGPGEVTKQKMWHAVAKKMGIKSPQGGSKVKDNYLRLIHPYVVKLEETTIKQEEVESEGEEGGETSEGAPRESFSMQSGKRRKGRMMAGLPKIKQPPRKKRLQDPMETVFCSKCSKGDDEDKLLLCETCDHSLHTFCCEPPLTAVPKSEWHCPDCSANQVCSMGANFGFYDANTKYNLISFAEFANRFKKDYFGKPIEDITDEDVEKEFWKNIFSETMVSVKYGADLRVDKVGSGFPRRCDDLRGVDQRAKQHYASHPWNLNNLPVLKDSVLSHIDSDISGMMVPWVYVGMCFSTFCWHTEDHWTYSINYNHKGERKIWYGIGGADAELFENVVRSISPGLFAAQRDLLHHMTIAVNPSILQSKNVPVWTVHQNAGEFVITFPRAYHAGYNEGFNVAEAVNFAPIDWLKMGRLAVSAYAMVRRTCVFSHEELVLAMVESCDKLSISMSVAAYEELHALCDREIKRRKLVASLGVRESAREIFEKITDEQRECKHCHTTVFLSALTCAHDRLVCLDHAHKLCTKCPYSKFTLKYRYELPELTPFLLRLKTRTAAYSEWREQVDTLLDQKEKPALYAIENLLETARRNRFPNGNALSRLHTIQRACLGAMERANSLLNGKVRTRTKTRIQRADPRPTIEEVEKYAIELAEVPCDLHELQEKVQDLAVRFRAWCDEAQTNCERVEENEEEDILDQLSELLEKGDDFDIKSDALERLTKCVRLCEWRRRAFRVLRWAPSDEMERADDFLTRGRWNSVAVIALIDEAKKVNGSRFEQADGIHVQLHAKMKHALVQTNECEDWISSGCVGGEERLRELWSRARESDWFDEKGMTLMREEVVRCNELLERLRMEERCLRDTEDLLSECGKSTVLRNSPDTTKLCTVRDGLISLTKRLIVLLHRPNSYYSLYEILAGRDDIPLLADGKSQPLYLREDKTLADEWEQLDGFEKCEELTAHCSKLDDTLYSSMKSLRHSNERRSPKDTCVCVTEKEKDTPTIACALCYAKYHVSCVEWDPFMARLPQGAYLCVRCVRSRRPGVEDMQAAANQAPANTLELAIVRSAISRVQSTSRSFVEMLADVALAGDELGVELQERVDTILVRVLTNEIVNYDLLPKVAALMERVWKQRLEQYASVWEQLKSQPSLPEPSLVLFAQTGKRKRSARTTRRGPPVLTASKRRRGARPQKSHEDEEDNDCEAQKCLHPNSDPVLWVQCEAGCSRWYHYVCVGLTKAKAAKLGAYACYRCKSSTD